jgi:hypothetical protein
VQRHIQRHARRQQRAVLLVQRELRRGLLAPVPTVEALKQVVQHLLFAVAMQVANVETHFANPRHATVLQAQPEVSSAVTGPEAAVCSVTPA